MSEREPWFPARDEACVDTILFADAQGLHEEAWALELKREARIDWELEQAHKAASPWFEARR